MKVSSMTIYSSHGTETGGQRNQTLLSKNYTNGGSPWGHKIPRCQLVGIQ